jgi:hypothetical protein
VCDDWGQGYGTPRGPVIDEYEAMVKWWFTGKKPKNSERNSWNAISFTSSRIKPGCLRRAASV